MAGEDFVTCEMAITPLSLQSYTSGRNIHEQERGEGILAIYSRGWFLVKETGQYSKGSDIR